MKSHDMVTKIHDDVMKSSNVVMKSHEVVPKIHAVLAKIHNVVMKSHDVVMIVSAHVLITFHDFQTVHHSQIVAGIQTELRYTGPLYKTFDKASHQRLLYKLAS